MMAGAIDQKAINATRKPAVPNDANVGNCPLMRNRRTRISTPFASAAPSATVRRKTVTSTERSRYIYRRRRAKDQCDAP